MPDFIQTDITVNNLDLLFTYANALDKAPEITNRVVNKTINDNADVLLLRLRVEPGAPHYPIAWTSEKQRRWFWAQVRAGKIQVPYQRAHQLVNSWRIAVIYDYSSISAIRVTNDAPERQYVTGANQQGYHMETGWYQEQNVFGEIQADIVDAVETDLIKLLYMIYDEM